jgi:peptidoglycan DL-endopeptidase CwlO
MPLRVPLLFAVLSSCATTGPLGATSIVQHEGFAWISPSEIPQQDALTSNRDPITLGRGEVLQRARSQVGKLHVRVDGQRFGDDCTGLVRGAYSGIDLMSRAEPNDNGVTAIWRFSLAHGQAYENEQPLPGDLVFFKETYDRNQDGYSNDGLTHIGIVEAVDSLGTIDVIHRVSRGVVRYKMNLEFRNVNRLADGTLVNDWLRSKGEPQLTAQLFYRFARVLPTPVRAGVAISSAQP